MVFRKFTEEEKMIGILAGLGVKFHFVVGQEVRISFPYYSELNGKVGKVVETSPWNIPAMEVRVENRTVYLLSKDGLRPRKIRDIR